LPEPAVPGSPPVERPLPPKLRVSPPRSATIPPAAAPPVATAPAVNAPPANNPTTGAHAACRDPAAGFLMKGLRIKILPAPLCAESGPRRGFHASM
jgi:hypothetical protein